MSKERVMERKTNSVEIKNISDSGEFEGWGAKYGNIDSYYDRIDFGACKKTLEESKEKVLLWQHEHNKPIGIFSGKEMEGGVFIKGKLNLEVEQAREALSLIKQGAIKGLSIGYSTIKSDYEKVKNKTVRILKEIKLFEISLVTFPANELATITDVKSADNVYKYIIDNKNKEGFKEKIFSLLEDSEPECKTSTQETEEPEELDYEYMLKKYNGGN